MNLKYFIQKAKNVIAETPKKKRQRVGLNTGPSTSETHVLPLSHQAMLAKVVNFQQLKQVLNVLHNKF